MPPISVEPTLDTEWFGSERVHRRSEDLALGQQTEVLIIRGIEELSRFLVADGVGAHKICPFLENTENSATKKKL